MLLKILFKFNIIQFKHCFSSLIFTLLSITLFGQVTPTIKFGGGLKEYNTVSTARQFIVGITCKECTVTINDLPVKVYTTGTFGYEVSLQPGANSFVVKSSSGNKSVERKVNFQLEFAPAPQPVSTPGIESIKTFPEGDLILQPGDKIYFEVKAFSGGLVKIADIPLYELPVGQGANIPGIYKGTYTVQQNDSLSGTLTATLTLEDGKIFTKQTTNKFGVISSYASDVVMTNSRLAHLKFGWGTDRLGGAKIGYIDSLIPLKILSKQGIDYKVELAPGKSAYIESEYVSLLPRGTTLPPVLTSKITVSGNTKHDFVKMNLSRKLPYESRQLLNPSIIEVDLYGAVNNTNWITQLPSATEISQVEYVQVSDEIFRIRIHLKHKQHWGHTIYYEDNNLVIRVKQQLKSLQLKDLVIAVDAGHGGSNTGTQGLTGIIEKNLTLDIALKLKSALELEGAKVIMTRTTERFFDNRQRILFYRDSTPDLLISIHFNGALDPINAGGTMMFYRYPGFKSLNESIYKRMQELGLKPSGITSSFNFMLNSPTEYPNALVEALFLSNLAEEEMIINEAFRHNMSDKILLGIKDFLDMIKEQEEKD